MKLLAAVLLATSLSPAIPNFYVGQKQYRFDKNDPRCLRNKNEASCYEEHREGPGVAYSLNFIEFKDDGTLFDSKQLDAARDQLRAAKVGDQTPATPTVFIYIHPDLVCQHRPDQRTFRRQNRRFCCYFKSAPTVVRYSKKQHRLNDI